MSILQKIVNELKENDITTKLRIICDQISEEERPNFKYPNMEIKGPRIFLCMETKGRTKAECGFLTLEQEDEDLYVIIYHTILKSLTETESKSSKRVKAWEIKENKPEKIITAFAKKLKFLNGE